MDWNQNQSMSWHRLVRRAYDIDLQEISLLAQAARTAPPRVACNLLHLIPEEAMGASFWFAISTMGRNDMPCYGSPYKADKEQKKDEGSEKEG